ncbi:hypothetical protein SCHPADRAFT_599955 [Schizopora paradoxa]|uniref:HRDC domain-containing protein n=1 Tax=Schizopora paradoxa TaxID=27342 RepID=A0A0H2R9Y3_9AGAM|nr:hypothetical protein SCHPADRAFT_599955 [Schizopora paradoxa]
MSSQAGSSKGLQIVSTTFDPYNEDIQTSVLLATKASTSLPPDIPFHRSVNSDFGKLIDSTSDKALKLTNRLLNLVSTSTPKSLSRGKGKLKLEDQADVADRFESLVVDALDHLLENADFCLDDVQGKNKARPTIPAAGPSTSQLPSKNKARLDPSLIHATHISKPQIKFSRPVDNFCSWFPVLRHKYNAQVPLVHNFTDDVEDVDMTSLRPRHPYEYEMRHISHPRRMFGHCDPIPPKSFDEVPLTWVNSAELFNKMLDKLRTAGELAVDLEYHNYRTFAGFVCLMQISTREEDFIVDTLVLREELQELNEVFTDSKIVKVFHGAESDIVWLQQNFNVYVVNLFDTYHASKELAALLEMYCDFVPDKRYQLADWRIRPLPEAMLNYARSDTHFLLFIYDNLRNALLDRSGGKEESVLNVLNRSRETSMRLYESELYDFETGSGPGGWDTLLQKWNKSMSGVQLAVFRAVHRWRDNLARKEDESTRYVLPNHYIFQLAERPPADMATLMAVFRSVPSLIRTHAASLLDAIQAANQSALSRSFVVDSVVKPKDPIKSSLEDKHKEASSKPLPSNTATNGIWLNSKGHETTTSTFLGPSSFAVNSTKDTVPATSTLFPSGWIGATNGLSNISTRYQEVLCKIHATMGVTPTMPVLETSAAAMEEAPSEIPGQIEIPFVPLSQRKPVAEEVPDTIVVVGQVGKKRKRVKNLSGESDPNKRPKDELQDDLEPFDYDSAANLLDGPSTDQRGKKAEVKPREKKGPNLPYGSFPAPPRAYNEVKAGNQSHTFR